MKAFTQIQVENFRCFRESQTARLAPITLLVGDNSTGKTSLLALLRAMWDLTFRHAIPNFKKDPYDLGSFNEIVHHRGGPVGRASRFRAVATLDGGMTSEVEFGSRRTIPVPVRVHLSLQDIWLNATFDVSQNFMTREFGTEKGTWTQVRPVDISQVWQSIGVRDVLSVMYYWGLPPALYGENGDSLFQPDGDSPTLDNESVGKLFSLAGPTWSPGVARPFAGAPVRSKPSRTYDSAHSSRDPEGVYVPMLLADMHSQGGKRWASLQADIVQFGKESGLFDGIDINQLGKAAGGPFQILLRKQGRRLKGPMRNIVDMGYGVSQVLPLIAEISRKDSPNLFLLQQPEVHLHPSAQAALGTLFCQAAGKNRQFIVETHSDHLMDRIRMEVRDGKWGITPTDVSILYFERHELDIKIHSLGIDEHGNILNAPQKYRSFFMEETRRSLQL